MTTRTYEEAAAARSKRVQVRHRPSARRSAPGVPGRNATGPLSARISVREQPTADGLPILDGFASVTQTPYEMWDAFGPYTEEVDGAAFDRTLANDPDVKFLFNHAGMPMARTSNMAPETAGSLALSMGTADNGAPALHSVAVPLPQLEVTQQVLIAARAGLLDEMSFAFMIVRGAWSDDYMKYTIYEVDLNRGDTSIVTYGANPHTSIDVRSAPALDTASTVDAQARARIAVALSRSREFNRT